MYCFCNVLCKYCYKLFFSTQTVLHGTCYHNQFLLKCNIMGSVYMHMNITCRLRGGKRKCVGQLCYHIETGKPTGFPCHVHSKWGLGIRRLIDSQIKVLMAGVTQSHPVCITSAFTHLRIDQDSHFPCNTTTLNRSQHY